MSDVAWLTIVGLGEEWVEANADTDLSHHAALKSALEAAEIIIGPFRFKQLPEKVGKQLTDWASGFDDMVEQVKRLKGKSTLILATGDPCYFGIAGSLSAHFSPEEVHIVPFISAFSFAAARLKWRLEKCEKISIHGRSIDELRKVAGLGKPILALTSGAQTILEAAQLYCQLGLENEIFRVLHNMGGLDEYHLKFKARDAFDQPNIGEFQLLAIEPFVETNALPEAPYLDADISHDSQMTKYEQRLLAVAKLNPLAGEFLIDIGAGSGSIAFEWLRQQPAAFAVCVEKNEKRAREIANSAEKLGLSRRLRILTGEAVDCLPQFIEHIEFVADAVFMGGGVHDKNNWALAQKYLKPSGRLVAHAVTQEGRDTMMWAAKYWDGELVEISMAKPQKLGEFSAFKPLMPILQLSAQMKHHIEQAQPSLDRAK